MRTSLGETVAGLLVATILAALPGFGGPPGDHRDVLLAAHPENLTLLNHYEQTATPSDRREIAPYAPLVVLRENAHLSDGFTPCMEVECRGRMFYLVKTAQGVLPADAAVHFERSVAWIGDTMRVIPGALLPVERPTGERTSVGPGTLLERFFESRGRIYVHALGDPSLYGWIDARSARRLSRPEERTGLVAASDSSIEAVVQAKIDATNSVLRQLYRAFNQQSHEGLGVPQWTIARRPGLLLCELTNARVSYDQSTRYLENDIENALLGTGVRIVESAGSIAVYFP